MPVPSKVPVAVMCNVHSRLINQQRAMFNVLIPNLRHVMYSGRNRHNNALRTRLIEVMVAAAMQAVNSPAGNNLPAAVAAAAVRCRVQAMAVPTVRPANAESKAAAAPVNKNHGAEEI